MCLGCLVATGFAVCLAGMAVLLVAVLTSDFELSKVSYWILVAGTVPWCLVAARVCYAQCCTS